MQDTHVRSGRTRWLAAFVAGHPQRVMLLCYLLAEELEAGRPGTVETAESVVQEAIARTEAAHQALWSQLRRSEKVVLAGVADGLPPASPALAADISWGATRCMRPPNDSSIKVTSRGNATRCG